ncbi:hypothetical protein DPMN_040068 [Dreissena polymorpha]|uniref:Uncharacterized protein n=1 Tax=Dreissena polymorpha TaxID=45954 RepID=A0A9D4CUD2_DREPO|nr:hypothetical protein DPMN_040068 [Dreissena polymorpha]
MFSSKGLFKDVSCPYFLFGLCERPYCHFKHSKQEEAKARVEIEKLSNLYTGSDDSTTNGLPVSSLQRTLKDIEQSIQTEKSILGNHSKPSGVTKNKPTGTPSYNPTPLNELEQKKNKGELGSGRSKYDLALLDGPSSDGEYDPASNFSTNLTSVASTSTLSRESPSDFAKPVVAGIKRKSETEDGNEDSCSLAKIPKFASVSYSPAVAEGSFSDEEHSGIPDGFLSDDQSEKARGSGLKSDTTKSCDKKSDLLKENNDIALSKEISPIEFNPDGTVNYPDRSAEDEKLKPKGKDATNEDVKSDKSDENIFSLFKQEFDSVLEGCANIDEQKPCIKTDHNVIKKSHSSGKCRVTNDKETVLGHKSSHHKSKSEKHKHKEITNSHDKIKSSACTPNKSDNTANFNHKDKSCSSNKESSSHNSLSTRQRKDSEKSSSSVVKNGMTKSSSSSKKHSHSDLKHNHRDSKHSHSDSKHSHSNSLKSEQKHKHERMSSKDHSRTSSKDSTDKSSSSASKHNTSSDKSSKHGQHKSHHRSSSSQSHSHPSSKTKSHSSSKSNSHHSSSKSKSAKQSTILSPTSSKKKQILNLDVDLFGDIDSDIEQPSRTADYDSDLEKLFEDDDPFDECLRIFNEENAKQASTSGGEKKKLKRPHEPRHCPCICDRQEEGCSKRVGSGCAEEKT